MITKAKTVKIDAGGKRLGRVAVEAAIILRAKDSANFAPHKDPGIFVEIINAEKIEFSKEKRRQKTYWRHSGYLGGIKFTSAEYLWEKSPDEVLRRAIYGMLPKNRLRSNMMRRLKIFSGNK